jgi:hypothetical protein
MANRILIAAAVSGLSGPPALATTIDFNGLVGANGSAFTGYSEAGYLVTPQTTNWLVGQGYGDPPPYIYFNTPGGPTTSATIAVTDGGTAFTFSGLDVYSSITQIPWTFTGLMDGQEMFTTSGTQPNTFGNFAEVLNAYDSDLITTLEITLSSTAFGENPSGLDNIVVTQAASVPEAPSIGLLSVGLMMLALARTRIMRKKVKSLLF